MLQIRFSLRGSIVARLALGYGLLLAGALALVALIFYIGTVGVLERSIDQQIVSIAASMAEIRREEGTGILERQIDIELHDRVDSDTELVGLLDAGGRVLAGNLAEWRIALPAPGELAFANAERRGGPRAVRLLMLRLNDGARLVVGRDLRELDAVRRSVERALLAGALASVVLAFAGALLLRSRLEARIGGIRRTAARIAGGELSSRIEVQGDDEFARLGGDINRMLDRIEALMEGVRHVSNAIAHDLRTPLGRARARLDRALQAAADPQVLAGGAQRAVEDIDGLISLFDKLLQIATVEAGVGARSFELLDLGRIARDMAELYEDAAEEQGMQLRFLGVDGVPVRGDRDLLASAVASLVDNAIKYAHSGEQVDIAVCRDDQGVVLTVRDYGLGVPDSELERVCQRFYRIDRSRHLPGNGLGLSTVSAIGQLHGATLSLRNASPGLEARLVFPVS
jgi:signal transduction histidine kinase